MSEWEWIEPLTIFSIHARLLAEHGGSGGVRDEGLIDSALARPQNLAAYGDPDAADLAAAYAYGLAKNHGFVDGNKRVALTVAGTFLAINNVRVMFNDAEAVVVVEQLAAGLISESEMAAWFRCRL